MSRPTDWDVLELDGDPTPGDPSAVRELARRFLEFAAAVEHASGQVTAVAGDGVVRSWVGQAGDCFRDELDEIPGQLQKLETSHRMVGNALSAYEPVLDAAQTQAGRALACGREARARRDQAQLLVGPARTAFASAMSMVTDPVPAFRAYATEAPQPDPVQVAQVIRNLDVARTSLDQARKSVQAAQDDLDVARRLALSAQRMRQDAAKTCAHAIRDASEAGIRNRSWFSWERLKERAGEMWHAAVRVARITVALLGVVVLLVGGPLAWAMLAVAIIVLVDTLVRYGNGQASLWEVGFALLDCVPSTKGLTTIGGLARGIRGAGQALRGGRAYTTTLLKNLLSHGGTVTPDGRILMVGGEALGDTHQAAKDAFVTVRSGDAAAGRAEDVVWAGEDGLTLTAEQNAAVNRYIDDAADIEPFIREKLSSFLELHPDAEMVGLDYALKSADSLKRKVSTALFHAPDISIVDSLARIRDSVRYTVRISVDTYSRAVRDTMASLESNGFERLDFKNRWGNDGYQGVNSTWRDQVSGRVFEIQFHTADSFDAKMVTHGLYEQARLPGASEVRRSALDVEQNEIFSRVPVPSGAVDLT